MWLGLYGVLLVALAVLWRSPQMHQWLEPQALGSLGRNLLSSPAGPMAVVLGYIVAVMAGMPVLALVSVGAMIFPPWPGIPWCLSGIVVGSVVPYAIGRFAGADAVDRWAHGRLAPVAHHLEQRGLVTVIAMRALPVAPFIVVCLAAGALRVRLRDYVVGTAIGLLPSHFGLFLFMDALSAAWRSPSSGSLLALAGCVLALGVVFWLLRKKLAPGR